MSESTSTKQTMDYLPDVPTGRSCLGDPQSLSRDSGKEKNPAAENVENSSLSPKGDIETKAQSCSKEVEDMMKALEVKEKSLSKADKDLCNMANKYLKDFDRMYQEMIEIITTQKNRILRRSEALRNRTKRDQETLKMLGSLGYPESGREFIDNIKASHHRSRTDSFPYAVFKPDETFPQRILEQITIQIETRKLYDWPGSNPYRLKCTGNCIFITFFPSHASRNL